MCTTTRTGEPTRPWLLPESILKAFSLMPKSIRWLLLKSFNICLVQLATFLFIEGHFSGVGNVALPRCPGRKQAGVIPSQFSIRATCKLTFTFYRVLKGLELRHTNLFLCDARVNPMFGNAVKLNPRLWRFLPLCDSQVMKG